MAPRIFSKVNHILGCIIASINFKGIRSNKVSYDEIKLKIINRKISGKPLDIERIIREY